MQGEDPELESYREMVSEAYPDPEEDIPAMVVTALESVDGAVTDELPLA